MYSENAKYPLTIQNRVTQHQLLEELEELRKAEIASLRCMKYESDRLLARYKHLKPYLTGSEASDVKMYTTHIPGFCFHRNGNYRSSTHRLNKEISRIPYQVLEDILFTDMEVDVEKIISLHLISAHSVDPNKSHSSLTTNKSYMSPTWKNISQADSRQQSFETDYTQLVHYSQLPVFVLQPNKEKNQSLSEDDIAQESQTSKKAHILINIQINNLINAILGTLAKINPAKFNEIVRISSCPALLNDLIEKPNVQIFLNSLIGNPLVSKPEHFYIRLFKAQSVCSKSANTTEAGQYSSTAFLLAIPENCKLLEKVVQQMHNILTKSFYQYSIVKNQNNLLFDDLSVISEDVLNETFASFERGTEPNIFDKFNLKKVLNAQSFTETLISTSSQQQNSLPFDKHFVRRYNNPKGWLYMSKATHGVPQARRTTEMDQSKLLSSILRQVSNAQRILIGNEIAKIKNRDVNINGLHRTRASMSDAMANVMSKKSLISLACSSTREQQELIFKPPSKGGLGFGSLIVGDRLGVYVSNYTKFAMDSDILKPYAGGCFSISDSQITIEESDLSYATIAKVKQDVANMETKKKMLRFLKAKIPGE